MLSRLEFGAEFENVEIFNMKDIGSKRVSSEEASSRSSLEHTEGRRKPAMQNFKSQSSYNLKSHPSLKRESRFMKAADTQQTQALPLPPSKTMKATPSSRRRASGGSSRRNGRKKWRNSGRKRNRGQRRRSGKASREAKRRGKSFEKRKRQSRASARRASKAASRAHEAEWTSTEMNQRSKSEILYKQYSFVFVFGMKCDSSFFKFLKIDLIKILSVFVGTRYFTSKASCIHYSLFE